LAAVGLGDPFDSSKIRCKHHFDGDGIWIQNPFSQIHNELPEVWCIQVEDDHSFQVGVTSGNCHYLAQEDFIVQKMMMAVAQETTIDSPNLFHVNSDAQYMKSRAELWATFKNGKYCKGIDDRVFEQLCDNTLLVADQCDKFQVDTAPKYPEIPNANDKLRKIVAFQLHRRGLDVCNKKFMIDGQVVTYTQQAKIELNRFTNKGFASYFLITRDLVQYGKKQGWPFSPRGSASGSLVCFLIGIHVLDPLLWGLSFDRFLASSRGGYMLNTKMAEDTKDKK
jgi:DNA polymerase III alpha subunit